MFLIICPGILPKPLLGSWEFVDTTVKVGVSGEGVLTFQRQERRCDFQAFSPHQSLQHDWQEKKKKKEFSPPFPGGHSHLFIKIRLWPETARLSFGLKWNRHRQCGLATESATGTCGQGMSASALHPQCRSHNSNDVLNEWVGERLMNEGLGLECLTRELEERPIRKKQVTRERTFSLIPEEDGAGGWAWFQYYQSLEQ